MNPPFPRTQRRRGVLLLVVLSMLTLFLLLGTAYLVVSTRSRVTARAFNRLIIQSDEVRIPRQKYLDAAMLQVLRGGTATLAFAPSPFTGAPAIAGSPAFESILEDKYGRSTTLTGTASQVAFASGTGQAPLLTLSSVSLSLPPSGTTPVKPAELPGRIVTLLPDGGTPTSHRIVQASGAAGGLFTVYVHSPTQASLFRLPKGPCPVVVNGREFDGQGTTNEAWDAFDNDATLPQVKNPFLARVEPSGTSVSSSTVVRASYLTTAQSGTLSSDKSAADSDNDGQKDGAFLDFGFQGIPTASGTIDLHAAVLIVDLDSRFNVNAHGSLAGRISGTGAGWPSVTGTTLTDIPLGSGYGPPEVNAAWMYPQNSTGGYPQNRQVPNEDNTLWLMTGSGTSVSGKRPSGSRFTVSGSTPALQSLQGRYGESVWTSSPPASYRLGTAVLSSANAPGDPLPGRAGQDDVLSQATDQRRAPTYDTQNSTWSVNSANTTGIPTLWWDGSASYDWRTTRSSYNSPPDLHGRMKSVALKPTAQTLAPRLAYAKVEWGTTETKDDPYEAVLGPSAASNGWAADPDTNPLTMMAVYDNIYSTAELEPVLRPYDSDSFRLPLRLSATLGSLAEESRFRVTTASWDTTAITGTAAANLGEWIRGFGVSFVTGTSPITGSLGGEPARGERFDLNRPLTNVKPSTYSPMDPYYEQRQAYFKDLYTLICAVLQHTSSGTGTPIPAADAAEYAQWAANVVEFRDADSTMTPFEYDPNPSDGWAGDGNVTTGTTGPSRALVWGAERPEILIKEVLAWEDDSTGGMLIALHRPWNASALGPTGDEVDAEPCDVALDTLSSGTAGLPTNIVDLGKKAQDEVDDVPNTKYHDKSSTTYPIWRLRIVAGGTGGTTRYLRFDTDTATANEFVVQGITADGKSKPKLGADQTLCIFSSTTAQSGTGPINLNVTGSARTVNALRVPGSVTTANRPARLYLERFSNPKQAPTDADWSADPAQLATGTTATTAAAGYVIVDKADVTVVYTGTAGAGPQDLRGKRRDVTDEKQALWRTTLTDSPSGTSTYVTSGTFPTLSGTNNSKWFPWPNRPFTSSAELFLVPNGNAIEMLQNYETPRASRNALSTLPGVGNQLLLLDAVHVPTRFAGIHRTVTSDPGNTLKQAGIYAATTPVNQLSSFREPGRVNLNTVTADDIWNAVVAGPLATSGSIPAPLKKRSPSGGTDASGTSAGMAADFLDKPATSMGALLSLTATGTGAFAPDTHLALVSSGSMNPAHLLYTANRLANTATIRSNVFAVWITLRESIQNDPDSVKYHRAFYIVDRSIPVAHEAGKDHNVWDSVILRRIIE
jgi:hypothetical protein